MTNPTPTDCAALARELAEKIVSAHWPYVSNNSERADITTAILLPALERLTAGLNAEIVRLTKQLYEQHWRDTERAERLAAERDQAVAESIDHDSTRAAYEAQNMGLRFTVATLRSEVERLRADRERLVRAIEPLASYGPAPGPSKARTEIWVEIGQINEALAARSAQPDAQGGRA